MSDELLLRIDEIRTKTLLLKKKREKLEKRNRALETEVTELRQLLDKEAAKTKELQNTIKIIKLAQNIGSSGSENGDISELKRKINEYIKEIDNCITMLND